MAQFVTPGVYLQEVFPAPPVELRTGVPAFLGYAAGPTAPNKPAALYSPADFTAALGGAIANSYLLPAVSAFFANGGSLCYAVRLDDALPSEIGLARGLSSLTSLDTVDLIAAPDIMRLRQPGDVKPDPQEVATMQLSAIDHCRAMGNRFAILDSLPGANVIAQRAGLSSPDGALYYPWVRTLSGALVPPCGHVAGVYARTDAATGVHKAPANEALEDAVDLEVPVTRADQDGLNPIGVNCIRAFPGRGILVWGARTLANDSAWTYVSTRRLFLTAGRWISRNLSGLMYEPNNAALWARATRELNGYFLRLHNAGALAGPTPKDSFYVKCDAETNPPDTRALGMLITEIGLAPGVPGEFIVVRIEQSSSGAALAGGASI